MPTNNGIAEAITAPNTKIKRMKVNGIEMASARAKSLAIRPLIADVMTPFPLA